MVSPRSQEKELIDLGPDYYTTDEYEQCMHQLFTINQLLGIVKHTINVLKKFPNTISVADLGCGGGLFLLNLSKKFPNMSLLGIDTSPQAIEVAKEKLHTWKRKNNNQENLITFQLQPSNEFTLSKESVDVVLLTLVCHHFDDLALIEFLQKSMNAARKVVIINDLQRHIFAYGFYKIFSPLLFRNRLITHDGLISIQRGFRRKELHKLLQKAGINKYTIKWRFPFWWTVLAWKDYS